MADQVSLLYGLWDVDQDITHALLWSHCSTGTQEGGTEVVGMVGQSAVER